ncbi:hypothetical protein pb186bvf_002741 [Paramecium bursaria]
MESLQLTETFLLSSPSITRRTSCMSTMAQLPSSTRISKSRYSFKSQEHASTQKQLKPLETEKQKADSHHIAGQKTLSRQEVTSPKASEYYDTFKNYKRVRNSIKLNNLTSNVYVKMLTKATKKNLLPRTFGMFSNVKHLSVAGQLTKPEHFDMFIQGLQSDTYDLLEELDLSRNFITPKQIEELAKIIPINVKRINLSQNGITKFHMIGISHILKHSGIEDLQLYNNHIDDSGFLIILEAMQQNKTLKVLNLSFNKISDQALFSLGLFLKNNRVLEEIYLQFNNITGIGGFYLFKGTYKNSTLKVIDLSYNNLGNDRGSTDQICKVLKKPLQSLIRIDLSHNKFTPAEISKIEENLQFSNIIKGIRHETKTSLRCIHIDKAKFDIKKYHKDLDYVLIINFQNTS